MRTTIQKWGNSQAVRLPKTVLDAARLEGNEQVQITAEPNIIIIKKVQALRHKTTKERIAEYKGEFTRFKEWDTGAAVGNECLREGELDAL